MRFCSFTSALLGCMFDEDCHKWPPPCSRLVLVQTTEGADTLNCALALPLTWVGWRLRHWHDTTVG